MKVLASLIIAILCMAAGFATAQQAKPPSSISIDCYKVDDPIDLAICRSPDLLQLQRKMEAQFQRAFEIATNKEYLVENQNEFVQSRRLSCGSAKTDHGAELTKCLGTLLRNRSASLDDAVKNVRTTPITRAEIDDLIKRADDANSACRGLGKQCELRDILVEKLKSNGWCHGLPEQAQYQKEWQPCPPSEAVMQRIGLLAQASRACMRRSFATAYVAGVYGKQALYAFMRRTCAANLLVETRDAMKDDKAADAYVDLIIAQEIDLLR